MKIVIIEDEDLAARRLENMIHKYDANIEVVKKMASVEESVEWFSKNNEPNIIFLDIHLEDGLSFSIFEKVNIKSPIIFTTAFDEYAIRAFKLKSIDYLLKPILQEDLNVAIEKYKEWNKSTSSLIDVQNLFDLITKKGPQYKSRFSITLGAKIKTIEAAEISYFYSLEGNTFLVTNSNNHYPLDQSLDNLMDMLDPKEYFRINRQFLIRLKAIKNVHVFPKSRLKVDLNPVFEGDIFVSLDKVTKFKDWLDA